MQTDIVLKIVDLKKTYGKDTYALKGVELDIRRGEFVVVIGPSGAGKSTLLRCLNLLIKPTSGSVFFNDRQVEQYTGKKLRELRSRMGMIFQHYNLIDRTNVIKNVLHGRFGHMNIFQSLLGLYSRSDRQKAYNLLVRVGLEDQIYKRADELSGGQKQRVGICRALLQEPHLLLADEPIASLDPKSADIVMDTLFSITRQQGLTAIVNLHQVAYAKKYATRIVGLKDGLVVFDDIPDNLTADLINDIYQGKQSQMTLSDNAGTDFCGTEVTA